MKLKNTVIISVYKNIKALKLILAALEKQTEIVNQIIISEDGNCPLMKEYVNGLNNDIITHLSCIDVGWRKNVALNKAILHSSGEYLIFIDGDVVPHKRFVEGHLQISEKRKVCCGKRSELGKKYSNYVYEGLVSIDDISNNYFKWIFKLHKDKVHHYEDGIYSKIINNLTSTRKIRHIIGCNFSCYKEDILKINGFNEDFIYPSEGEDVDITWRFRGLGIEMKSCRYIANVYHLWHEKGFTSKDGDINKKIMFKNIEDNRFVCSNGLKKLSKENK